MKTDRSELNDEVSSAAGIGDGLLWSELHGSDGHVTCTEEGSVADRQAVIR